MSRCVLGLVGVIATVTSAAAEPSIDSVHIVSSVDRGDATDRPKRARRDQTVTLHAVVRSGSSYFSDVPKIVIAGRAHRARPLAEAPGAIFVWHKIEPAVETMSNEASGRFRFETIAYVESLMLSAINKSTIAADVRPTHTTDRGHGVGTMRYQLTALTENGPVKTPGREARTGRGGGGLTDAVHRVTIRRDDSYIGFLTELYGQPYIWASAGTTPSRHQSERLEGSDCADFVVYGRRRMGKKLPYTWTGALPDYTRLLARRATARADGVYVDDRGEPIKFPRVGDLVLFPRHVGVLTADRGHEGLLDHADVMMHSYFASPREQAIGDSDYARTWLEVRRWR